MGPTLTALVGLVLGLAAIVAPAVLILMARDAVMRLSMAPAARSLPKGRIRMESGRDAELELGLINVNGSTRKALRVTMSRPPGPLRELDPGLLALLGKTKWLLRFQPTPTTVTMWFSRWKKPQKTARWVARIVDEIAASSPWRDVAKRRRLELDRNGRIAGELNGFRVLVRANDDETNVRVRFETAARAVHKDLPLASEHTGNPVLDGLVKVAGPLDPHDPQVVEALLAVIHGHPGSRVDEDGVLLEAQGPVEDVEPLLDAAVRLAEVLRGA